MSSTASLLAEPDEGPAIERWHQTFLAPLLDERASIESKRSVDPGAPRLPSDELVMVLTDDSQRPSTEFPGLSKQFCSDLHRAQFDIGDAVDAPTGSLDERLGVAQKKLNALCGGDGKLAFLASAVANQSLLSLVMDAIQSGRMLVEQSSDKGTTTLAGCSLLTELGGKSPRFRLSAAEGGAVLVEGRLRFDRIASLVVGDEIFDVDPGQSGGTASISVKLGPAPGYSVELVGMTSDLHVELASSSR